MCEEPLEFLGITQNIYGQEFDNDFSKNEIHICIILNTVESTQKQTYCFFHITWKSKTTVFLLLKLKRQKKPVPYYSNTSTTQRLVLSGDIEENPGPIQDRKTVETTAVQRTKTKAKCPNCTKTIQSNHKRFLCTVCLDLYHAKCINLKGNDLRNIRADKPQDWLCTKCQITTLPFFNCQQEEFLNAITDNNIVNNLLEDSTDEHLEALTSKSKQFKLMHLNTQSMVSTFDELLVTIREYPFDVIAMSETWMKNNPHLLQYVSIPGYTNLFRNRDEIREGGVGLSINFKRRTDIEKIEPELEQIWVEISGRNKNSKLLLGVMYRSNRMQDFQTWIDKSENVISQLCTEWDGLLVITGDFNIDLLRPEQPQVKQYIDMLESLNLHQHVEQPTRITANSKTLIDHIISNIPSRVTHTGVLPCPTISDHDAPYACINVRITRFEPRFKIIRNERQFVENAFLEDVAALPLNIVYSTDDANDKLEIFNSLFKSSIDRHAPLRKMKITRPPAPWLNAEDIKQLQSERNKLRHLAHVTKKDSIWQLFREIRNKIKTKIKETKRSFYRKALSSRKPKDLWRTIYRILHPSQQQISADPNVLNHHFSTTSQRLLGTSPSSPDDLRNLINTFLVHTNHSFTLRPATFQEVLSEIKGLRSDCSTGPDQIPVKYIKLAADWIASPLTHIINHYITITRFQKLGSLHEFPQYLKLITLSNQMISGLLQFCQFYQKFTSASSSNSCFYT